MRDDDDRPVDRHSAPERGADRPVGTTSAGADEPRSPAGEVLEAALASLSPRHAELSVSIDPSHPVELRVLARLTPGVDAEREALAAKLVRAGADLVVVPLVYTSDEWSRLDVAAGPGWGEPAESSEAPGLVELYERRARHPKPLRRMVLRLIRDHRSSVSRMRRTTTVPVRLGASLCAAIVEECFEILFALAGRTFRGTADDQRYFAEHLAERSGFRRGDAGLHLCLRGLAEQVRRDDLLTGRAGRRRYGYLAYLRRVAAFLDSFERHVRRTLFTEAERRVRTRLRYAAIGLVSALIAAAVGWYFVDSRPRQPISDRSVVRHRGGIVGTYYKGRDFDERVFARVDRSLSPNFGSTGPDAKLPADNFSVRWSGYVYYGKAGTFRLCAWADDGVRVTFDRDVVLDDWQIGPPQMPCERINVLEGWYPIEVEYFEAAGPAQLKLLTGRDREHLHGFNASHLCCRR